MSNYIVEYINEDIFIKMSISDFRITFKENEKEIMMFGSDERIRIVLFRGDEPIHISLEDFICIKNNNGVVLYTKEELESRVPRKENLERLIPKFTQEFGNAFKEIIKKHKMEQK